MFRQSSWRAVIAGIGAAAVVGAFGATVATQSPNGGFALPSTHAHWMAAPGDIDGDGNEEIVLTTMDPGKVDQLTPPTPAYILGVAGGIVINRSSLFAGSAPKVYSGKPTIADFDGDGRLDILFCDKGRNAGPNPGGTPTNTLGVWAGQNQVLLQRDGVLVDFTDKYPQILQSSWGCSAGDVDRSGRATLGINNFVGNGTWATGYLIKWDGTAFQRTLSLVTQAKNGFWPTWGWTTIADFNKDGFADVVGGTKVLWGGQKDLEGLRALPQSRVEQLGYTFWRGTLAVDFTGDGYPDLIKESGIADGALTGARFALYESDRKGALIEKVDAFPDLEAYQDSEFSNDLTAVDVNFDGFLDIVNFGTVYTSYNGVPRPPISAWLNDGTGRFTLAHWVNDLHAGGGCGSNVLYEAYFLKTSDPQAFNLVVGGCGAYRTRTVTPARPLVFTK